MFTKQLTFLNTLFQGLDARCYIAGGAPRNVRAGLPAKDYDVIVLKGSTVYTADTWSDHSDAFVTIKKLSERVSTMGGSSFCYFAYGQSNDPAVDFSERLWACLKVTFEDDHYDLLLQRATSLGDAIGAYDCNLNQYFVWHDGEIYYDGIHPEDELHFLKPVRQSRIEKMTKFFKEHIEGKDL